MTLDQSAEQRLEPLVIDGVFVNLVLLIAAANNMIEPIGKVREGVGPVLYGLCSCIIIGGRSFDESGPRCVPGLI